MKRRLAAAILFSSVCTLSACSISSQAVSPSIEPQAELPSGAGPAAPDSQGQPINTPQEQTQAKTQNTNVSNNTSIVNLTDNLGMSVTIDYLIDNYDSLQSFSYELFKENIDEENPVLSPLSAYLALSMAGTGASGNTRDEFTAVLGEDMLIFADDIMESFPVDSESMKLSINNSAWIDDQLDINAQWLSTVRSFMDADVFQSDISGADAMDAINNWVSTNTNGLIDNMLDEPLGADARLALINTVYFKADWSDPFKSSNTKMEEFKLDGGGTCQAEMMNKYAEPCEYISNDFAEGVILPYRNDMTRCGLDMRSNLALVMLKPLTEETVGSIRELPKLTIRGVYSRLTGEVISDLLVNRTTESVNLKIPKFEVTFDKILNDSLTRMGLADAFDEQLADFSDIGEDISGGNLFISLVRQKAKVIVDETGTEAAAATEVMIELTSVFESLEPPRNVYFDEPFIYIIMDMDREIPLFIGIIDNPMSAGSAPCNEPDRIYDEQENSLPPYSKPPMQITE